MSRKKAVKTVTEAVKRVTKRKKPTQTLFSDVQSKRRATAENIGTRMDPDTGAKYRYSPKEGEKVTKGSRSVAAEDSLVKAMQNKSSRERAKKYSQLETKEDSGKALTKAEKKFMSVYEKTEKGRSQRANVKAAETKGRKKGITVSTGTVKLGEGRRYQKGGSIKPRGCGAAMRGFGKAMK